MVAPSRTLFPADCFWFFLRFGARQTLMWKISLRIADCSGEMMLLWLLGFEVAHRYGHGFWECGGQMKVLPLARMATLVPSLRPPPHRWRCRCHCSAPSLHSPGGLSWSRSSLLPAVPCRVGVGRSATVPMLRALAAHGSRQFSGTPSWLLSSRPWFSYCTAASNTSSANCSGICSLCVGSLVSHFR